MTRRRRSALILASIAVGLVCLWLSGCQQQQYRTAVLKRAEFHKAQGGAGPFTVYHFEDGSMHAVPRIVTDVPAPGTVMRIAL